MTGLRAVNLEDDGVKEVLNGSLFDDLKQKSEMKACILSSNTQSLLAIINQSNISFLKMRKSIKCFVSSLDEEFDPVEHADINFIETTGLHL
ncbi:hypothetical protein MFLAVUS_008493 [Mucor flavus]|uniref:Uncharacterized protein n=1 Tax=Mucor flavus TaxID=439312 RepID=A0ABP9Z7C5_9FUNG